VLSDLIYIEEPLMMFGNNQTSLDPRDGLLLFGPYEPLKPYSVKAGIIGPKKSIDLYRSFVKELNKPILSTRTIYGRQMSDEIGRPSFPGFESIFEIQWPEKPEIFIGLDSDRINLIINAQRNKTKRTSELVDMYLEQITSVAGSEDINVNIWFIIVPRELYAACKPMSEGTDLSKATKDFLQLSKAGQSLLPFPGYEDYLSTLSRLLDASNDFHHLLKARLIQTKIQVPVQLIVESTLQFRDKYKNIEYDENMKAHLAWTQSTTLYYKLGRLPWKLHGIRDGVCYLGLVFKKMQQESSQDLVCSAAQMFLKDGDGAVFRGNIGLWQSKSSKEYHLDEKAAYELLEMALTDYYEKWHKFPVELFIHGKARFDEGEWLGFKKAIENYKSETRLTGVVIKESDTLKLYRDVKNEVSRYGVMRGIGVILNDFEGYLFTRGFIPRLNTSSSLEIPNPLHIKIVRGKADIIQVMRDVLGLTKLNYNACLYGDGLPVTLRFSDIIGSVLTATSEWKTDTRQFKFYI
jgi:hypothetical protein